MKSGELLRVSGNMFAFQQDSAPAHRARDTIELLRPLEIYVTAVGLKR